MEKEYDRDEVEKYVDLIKKRIEPQVAKELCKLLRIERPYDITTIKGVEEDADYGPGFSQVVRGVQKEILKKEYNVVDWRHLRISIRKFIKARNKIMESVNGTRL